MKAFLLFLLLAIACSASAQSIVNPDTVCFGATAATYTQPPLPGYTFTWVVSAPGVITAGQNTNQIIVNWSSAGAGLIPGAVSVSAVNSAGCQTPPVNLDVFILQLIPSISALGPFCNGEPCAPLVANPTGGVFSGIGVVGNQFCPTTSGQGTFNVGYSVTIGGCTFNTSLPVTVNNTPTLPLISHD